MVAFISSQSTTVITLATVAPVRIFVVLPAPRNPVITVTGILFILCCLLNNFAIARNKLQFLPPKAEENQLQNIMKLTLF
ncbi:MULTISPECIES: hypothetical protein [unclassified Nostoc]|uniref:hypothetical protein n=1 Tax=unclassified Nostoc TaxID=2593658 RepID=UPI0015E46FE3|nr:MULTISPECIES: hypothetical protein [unclassified Nostoc]